MLQGIDVFRAPFLPPKTTLEFQKEVARVALYLSQLQKIVPQLKRLQACEIVPVLDRTSEPIQLIFYLRAHRHSDLFTPLSLSPFSPGNDAFLSEVAEVKRDIAYMPTLIASSLSAGITAATAREFDKFESPEATIRSLFSRTRGLHVLSGYSAPKDMSTFPLFAQGVPATICATVFSIFKRRVKLTDVSFVCDRPASLAGVDLSNNIWLTNIGVETSDNDALLLFRHSQDGKSIRLEVVLTLDFAGGQIHSAELRRIFDISRATDD
jgi:hypothetical protein